MPASNTKLIKAVEDYFSDLQRLRASGGATDERSGYVPLGNLLDAIGQSLTKKVFCISEPTDQGAGRPDFGLYTAKQVKNKKPQAGRMPECGVVEVKAPAEDIRQNRQVKDQVSRYWARYRLVLVTNYRDFVLLGEDAEGRQTELETFQLAGDEGTFETLLGKPRTSAREHGERLVKYLSRVLPHRASITDPKDLAQELASYAQEGLTRVEAVGDVQSLEALRSALEEALGVRFKDEKSKRFFYSTLVQTLFYGIFSAWVLWAREHKTPADTASFNWREADWHLSVPVLEVLFQQIASPRRLKELRLVEVLDWAAAVLNRVDRASFFNHFDEGEAVLYFYEPFLKAFDPELRKQLGVWYTPKEVVRYMVARVDQALKDDLNIKDGLAADNVYVLDPCCGTGTYLSEVMHRIAENLESKGIGALAGEEIKSAAMERVFGFEIMPAPLVVAHLQMGLTMQALGAPLKGNGKERPRIFLTNALTGWEPQTTKPLPFPELEEERDRAEEVKQKTPILVVLGNPPYNAFAGVNDADEEQASLDAYRRPHKVKLSETKGLTDLYIRFFRMAERRITEKTGQGVVCFISNYSWLDGLSFAGMRERYLNVFDAIRIDCLNGDVRSGGRTPDGLPDQSIFTTKGVVGIKVGTAITTLVRKNEESHSPASTIRFQHLWGQDKQKKLLESLEADPDRLYREVRPIPQIGLPFMPTKVSREWFDWPEVTDLFPKFFSGAKTNRPPLPDYHADCEAF